MVDEVSTICGSGWVDDQLCDITNDFWIRPCNPPATAGGTDCLQRGINRGLKRRREVLI